MEPPEGAAGEGRASGHRENERVRTRHGELPVVDALPLHLRLMVCDSRKVPEK